MKTILYAYSSPTLHHGSPMMLVDIITSIQKVNFHPIFICPKPGELTEYLKVRNIEVYIEKWKSIKKNNVTSFVKNVLYFRRFIKQKKVHLLHMNQIGWRDSLVTAAWLTQIPIILHLHLNCDGPIQTNSNFHFASKIIVVSNAVKYEFKNYPKIYKKLQTVHNALDCSKFEYRKDIRIKLGLSPETKVIGYVGQIVEAKGLKFLVYAAKNILEQYPETVFIFVGRQVEREPKLLDELMSIAYDLNISHALRFYQPRNDIPDVMNSLDILVLPTLAEAFGKVIIEGMASGVCVVASSVGGIPEIIDNEVNGILVQPGSVDELGNALIRLLGDPGLRKRLGKEGQRTVRESFSIQKQMSKIIDIYNNLL